MQPAPPPVLTPAPPPVPATDPQLLRAFRASALSYDDITQSVHQGNGHVVEREELYRIIQRPDLIAESESRATKRTWIFVGAGATTVLGIAAGVGIIANARHLNDPYCVANLNNMNNDCIPSHDRSQVIGVASIAAGVLGGSLLAYWGFGIQVDPLTPDEKQRVIAAYNGQLMGRLRQNIATVAPRSIRVLPQFDTHSGGLVAVANF
jgi:hypothetical protein